MKLLNRISEMKVFSKEEPMLDKLEDLKDSNLHPSSNQPSGHYITFTMCYIALAARLISLDRPANKLEMDCFIESFAVNAQYIEKITELFESASKDTSPKEFYISQIRKLFGRNYGTIQSLINDLVKIAVADDYITNKETNWLIEVGASFGFTYDKIIELINYHLKSDNFDPYDLLGLSQKNITKEILNKNYRHYANIYHPDKLSLYDVSKEYLKEATSRFNDLTRLYQEARSVI
jgi:DnaJ-domain-containing protein 1